MAVGKNPKVDTYERIKQVAAWISAGYSNQSIEQRCSRTWGVGPRQSQAYLRAARIQLEGVDEQDFEAIRERHFSSRRMLFELAVAQNNYGAAIAILKDEAMLRGLYPSIKKDEHIKPVDPTELEREIENARQGASVDT